MNSDLLDFSDLHADNDVMFYTETNGIDAARSLLDFNRTYSQLAANTTASITSVGNGWF